MYQTFINNLDIKLTLLEPEDIALKNFKDKHEQSKNVKWEVQIESIIKVYSDKDEQDSTSMSFNVNDYSLISEERDRDYNSVRRERMSEEV